MTCNRCGICCNTIVTEIKPKDIRLISMRENFVKVIKDNGKTFAVMQSKCSKLSSRGCTIYGRRPESCKIFPSEEAKNRWKQINPDCGMLK